jgi:hypothetical protein
MTTLPEQHEYRRFSAPREDRSALVDPPFAAARDVIAENVERRLHSDYDFQGRSFADLCAQARAELLAAARRWTDAYRRVDLPSEDPAGLVLLAGHQPELFHPGVWFKNFALGELARRHGAAAVNLVIDSDTTKHLALRVPGGTATGPRVKLVPLDQSEPLVPYEERQIVDGRTFAEFGPRAAEWIAPLVRDPLVREYWPMVLERARHTRKLGYCLAQARHQLEGRWGLQTLEVPQSWVCACESFAWLVAHLVAEAPRFREVYNQAAREYRAAHGIRNAAHPVPDLAAEGPWTEVPFWVWTTGEPQRRRLFVRQAGRETVLSDRRGLECALPLAPGADAGAAVARLVELARRGVKIRSRALVTTLWARLVLGDLFLHGIGGAKYDQVTDRLIERFFGLRAPTIMVLSATLLLPIQRRQAVAGQANDVRRQLRDLTYHPERFLGDLLAPDNAGGDELWSLLAAKQQWVRTPQTPENAHSRWRAFCRINAALQPYVEHHRRQLVQTQSQTAADLRAEAILAWREYGSCLYPEELLHEFLEALLPRQAVL